MTLIPFQFILRHHHHRTHMCGHNSTAVYELKSESASNRMLYKKGAQKMWSENEHFLRTYSMANVHNKFSAYFKSFSNHFFECVIQANWKLPSTRCVRFFFVWVHFPRSNFRIATLKLNNGRWRCYTNAIPSLSAISFPLSVSLARSNAHTLIVHTTISIIWQEHG